MRARGVALSILVGALALVAPVGEARSGPDESARVYYCLFGDGNGQGWTFTITSASQPVPGSAPGVNGTAFQLRDQFVASILEAISQAGGLYLSAEAGPPRAHCMPPAAVFSRSAGTTRSRAL